MVYYNRTNELIDFTKILILKDDSLMMNKSKKNEPSQFTILSKDIFKNMSIINIKIDTLKSKISQKKLIDNNDDKLNNLIADIKTDLNSMQHHFDYIINYKNQPIFKSRIQLCVHYSTVVNIMEVKLKNLTSLFKQLLQNHYDNLQQLQKRKEKFQSKDIILNKPKVYKKQSKNTMNEDTPLLTQNPVDYNFETVQQQKSFQRNKTDGILKIEKQLQEVSVIYDQITILAAQQGELIERIDDNLYTAENNVNKGRDALNSLYESL